MEMHEAKVALRDALRRRRAEVPPGARVTKSALACDHLRKSEAWPAGGAIALFAPIRDEADPTALAVYAPDAVAYPRVEGDQLCFHVAHARDLTSTPPFGVPEPSESLPAPRRLALVVVPGLGFTESGDRIGYGRGFYDRALRALRATHGDLVAVGFGFQTQLEASLPVGPDDALLDGVVTEDGFRWCEPRRSSRAT